MAQWASHCDVWQARTLNCNYDSQIYDFPHDGASPAACFLIDLFYVMRWHLLKAFVSYTSAPLASYISFWQEAWKIDGHVDLYYGEE